MKRHFDTYKGRLNRIPSETIYTPKCQDDLVINRNRLRDINDWLECAVLSRKACLLLLTGPAGCGKTVTIRVLATEKRINIVEWTTPVDTFETWDSALEWNKPVNIVSKFRSFLLSTGRYSSVIKEEFRTLNKKVIIVKDFPTQLVAHPEEFRNLIDTYVVHGTAPIVFICTDSVNKKNKDIAYELFTESFKQKHGLHHIALLPIPVTSVVKALKCFVKISKYMVSEELIRQIAEESHGDIRKAINSINFHVVGGNFKSKISCSVNYKKKRDQQLKGGRNLKAPKEDDSNATGLFQAVGRVLYAKRNDLESLSENNREEMLNARGELVHKPMDIVKHYSHYANQFVTMCHSNYLDIFSSVDSIAKAAEYLSDADIIMSEWREKELLTTVGFGVAVAGLMESNDKPVRKWKPLRGSQWNEDLKSSRTNLIHVQDYFSDYCTAKLDICLEIIPFISQMWSNRNTSTHMKCKYGFLPHCLTDMLTVIRDIKTVSSCSPSAHKEKETNDRECDHSIHISDDSD